MCSFIIVMVVVEIFGKGDVFDLSIPEKHPHRGPLLCRHAIIYVCVYINIYIIYTYMCTYVMRKYNFHENVRNHMSLCARYAPLRIINVHNAIIVRANNTRTAHIISLYQHHEGMWTVRVPKYRVIYRLGVGGNREVLGMA